MRLLTLLRHFGEDGSSAENGREGILKGEEDGMGPGARLGEARLGTEDGGENLVLVVRLDCNAGLELEEAVCAVGAGELEIRVQCCDDGPFLIGEVNGV